jgi:DUF218 domain
MFMITNLLVAGRGHDILPNGNLALGASTIARVDTAVEYFHNHQVDFDNALATYSGGKLVMSGGYATMATGNVIAAPPYELREGSLMTARAIRQGVPAKHVCAVTSPTTTLEVVLRPVEEGHFTSISAEKPLAIVTQVSQWPRLRWFAHRILNLDSDSVLPIFAPGENDPNIIKDEQLLMTMTKFLYGAARTPQGLRRAERIAYGTSNMLARVGMHKPPAHNYLELH